MESDPLHEPAGLLASPTEALRWLELQPPGSQESQAGALFERQLKEAGQPRSVSGQACVRLCGFVEQLLKAKSEELRGWAFSRTVTLRLFNFYTDWNESDHHRSMKLVLDLIVQSIRRNPDEGAASETRACLIDRLLSVVTGRSTKPVAKSAIKSFDHFLTKGVLALDDIRSAYVTHRKELTQRSETEVWRCFVFDIFNWMRLHFVCPTAGRFVVSIYQSWRRQDSQQANGPSVETWYQWLLDFASEDPSLLESIKNYIFLPLFKVDRAAGLRFLQTMNEEKAISTACSQNMDVPALLQLAALETGKKIGLVEEPNLDRDTGQGDDERHSVTIHERILDKVLVHPSHSVRTLALSLLVTSPSTTRPYSLTALELLRKHMGAFFADPDAKFRVEVAGKVRDMFKRVRGAVHVLKRSIPRARANALKASANRTGDKDGCDSDGASRPILYRSNLISLPEAQLTACLEYHEEFLKWYLGFLCHELVPTASYQRHIASLKALNFILRIEGEASKSWETDDDQRLFFDVFDGMWARALFDRLMDPFEDVRDASASAIRRIYGDSRYRKFSLDCRATEGRTTDDIAMVSKRAEALASRTSRADHSDGASRAAQLLYRFLDSEEKQIAFLSKLIHELDLKISVAESDLGRAVLDAPLHGDLASLNHVWQATIELKLSERQVDVVRSLQSNLVACCERVWAAVKDVLCDDSPEGHLPQELEEIEGLDTKGLLSFSFRAVHESSNLMRSIVLTARNRSRPGLISPTTDVFERIGNLTFNQLSSLRHRGAFTTVASTFASCCQQAKHVDQDRPLLDMWYQGTIESIFSQASTTRRSAGIPSLMTGVLSANASHPSFQHVMERLVSIAGREARVSETDGSNLPQVHAYNCLKDIFKNSTLASMGNNSETYLPRCLELAATALRSEVWAIRNCGLLLLRSLIDCLFGSQESKAMIEAGWDGKANRIPYHRYPNLPTVLRNLLVSGHQMLAERTASGSAAESVFPALDIIRRAGPPEILRDEIQTHVAVYLSSPVWHVRELAARTLCSCLLHEGWLQTIEDEFQSALHSRGATQNHVHGVLLTLKFLIERLGEVAVEHLTGNLHHLEQSLTRSSMTSRFSHCPDLTAAYVDVVNAVWAFEWASSLPLSPFEIITPVNAGSALLRGQITINSIYAAAVEGNPVERLHTILSALHGDVDGLVTALETIAKLWHATSTSDQRLAELSRLYIDTCCATRYPEAQTAATQSLAAAMDQLSERNQLACLPPDSLARLWDTLSSRPMNPALSNAVVGLSGRVMAALTASPGSRPADLRAWGRMMSDAGSDDKVRIHTRTYTHRAKSR
ncbi:hypothetical protein CDD83_799 [Cordyceps sp. RAO-2017]|nr:hypothetical protein CDD83_799 [Cordyceps sp. RAO-2017]